MDPVPQHADPAKRPAPPGSVPSSALDAAAKEHLKPRRPHPPPAYPPVPTEADRPYAGRSARLLLILSGVANAPRPMPARHQPPALQRPQTQYADSQAVNPNRQTAKLQPPQTGLSRQARTRAQSAPPIVLPASAERAAANVQGLVSSPSGRSPVTPAVPIRYG